MRIRGSTKDVEVAKDCTLNEIEEDIAYQAFPLNVHKAFTAKASGAKIAKVRRA